MLVAYDPALAIKATIPRPVASGDLRDTDVFGAQFYGRSWSWRCQGWPCRRAGPPAAGVPEKVRGGGTRGVGGLLAR